MSKREREKICVMDPIELILLLPDVSSAELTTLYDKDNQLVNSIDEIQIFYSNLFKRRSSERE